MTVKEAKAKFRAESERFERIDAIRNKVVEMCNSNIERLEAWAVNVAHRRNDSTQFTGWYDCADYLAKLIYSGYPIPEMEGR